MQEKHFNINGKGFSIRSKLYFSDIKAIKRAVVYVHGFGGHKDNKAAQRFADYVLKKHRDAAVVTFDAPCHGDDVKKKLLLEDCRTYIGAVCDHVRTQFKTDEVYAYATSFGGFLVLSYIHKFGNPFRKIALRCPAVNMFEVLSDSIMTPAEQKALSRNKPVAVGFDRKINITRQFLEDLKAEDIREFDFHGFSDDIIIIHGTKDEVVPFDASKAFAGQNDILFVPIDGADHRFMDPKKMDSAIKEIVGFFEF